MSKNALIILLLIFLSASCEKSFNTPEELSKEIAGDEKFTQKKIVSGFAYELQYRPTDIMVNSELVRDNNQKDVESLRRKYRKNIYFLLKLSEHGKEIQSSSAGNDVKFGNLINNITFKIPEKVFLTSGSKDTLNLVDFVYPRMYGFDDASTILLAYKRDEKFLGDSPLNFSVKDLVPGLPKVDFEIDTYIIKNEPTLKL